MAHVVHATCPHDCPDACAVLVTIEDGRAVRVQGDPSHPVTRGFLCAKVTKYLERVYSPDRVLYPLRRVAPKGVAGPEAYQRISWDEALDVVAARLKAAAAEFGPESVLPFSYGGTLGQVQNGAMDRRFFHRIGASQLERSICSEAGGVALAQLYGAKMGVPPEDTPRARYIIAWGANLHGNNVHLWPFVEEARRAGARLVVIDPFRTRTARAADWHLPIRPGTDVALALGMIRAIVAAGRHDAEFIAAHSTGFEELRRRAEEFPPERVAEITGLATEDILRLAHEYASTSPSLIRLNYGIQRVENGGMAVRAVAMLPIVTGAWRRAGGGLTLSTSGSFPLNKAALARKDLMTVALGRPARTLNMNQLGRLLTDRELAPPVKALVVYACNPAAVCPNHNLVVEGLRRSDLFTVVHEQFLTDTCDYADIVLPATTFLEHKDLVASYGHMHLQLSEQAIAPLGECCSNTELFRRLGARMGLSDAALAATDDEMIDDALATDHPWLEGMDRAALERAHSMPLCVPREDGAFLPFAHGFATASGKAELASAELAAQGLDSVASFTAPQESRFSPLAAEYPLELLARKHDNFLNSSFCNQPGLQRMERRFELQMNQADAARRGIAEGDELRVFNQRGELRLRARLDDSVPPGVVAAYLDWARLSPGGRNLNALTSDRLTDIGAGATFYSALVEVEKSTAAGGFTKQG